MRFGHVAFSAAVLAGLALVSPRHAAGYPPIDAEKGKQYKLTKKHGPWMIMVASFNEPPPELKSEKGLTPDEAADELVFELRKKGIPAYKYARDDVVNRVAASDRIGRQRSRMYIAQQGSTVVLAGNYSDPDNDVAQKTLEYIKDGDRFMPEFLKAKKTEAASKRGAIGIVTTVTGARFRTTPGRQSPLGGAFLTLNPMLSPEEAAARKDDPLILRLNGSSEHSLLNNPGKYTVVVATFAGQSQTQVGNIRAEDIEKKFESRLDTAGQNAFELCQALRQGKHNLETDPGKPPRYQPVKAWVFHDRYRSYVTVGEFDTPNGEKVQEMIHLFGAKERVNPLTKAPFTAAEKIIIPSKDPKKFPDRMWIFDPQPIVMPVPKVRL